MTMMQCHSNSSQEWHERRRLSIGASDSPVILGLSPYSSAGAVEIAWEKRGLIPIPEDAEDSIVHRLEAVGRRWLSELVGADVDKLDDRDSFVLIEHEGVKLHANLDGRILYRGEQAIYEHKAISNHNPEAYGWRRGGIPLSVRVQVQHQMMVSGLDHSLIALFNGSNLSYQLRHEEADKEFHQWLKNTLARWWDTHVVGGLDPEPTWGKEMEALCKKRWGISPVQTEPMLADEHMCRLVSRWEDAKKAKAESTKTVSESVSEILYLMGDRASVMLPDQREVRKVKSGKGWGLRIRGGLGD